MAPIGVTAPISARQRRMLAVPVGGGLIGAPGAHQHLFPEVTPDKLERDLVQASVNPQGSVMVGLPVMLNGIV